MMNTLQLKVLVPLFMVLTSQIGLVNQELEDSHRNIMLEREEFLKNEEQKFEQRIENAPSESSDEFPAMNTPENWCIMILVQTYVVLRFLFRRQKLATSVREYLTYLSLLDIIHIGWNIMESGWFSRETASEDGAQPTFCSLYSGWLLGYLLLPLVICFIRFMATRNYIVHRDQEHHSPLIHHSPLPPSDDIIVEENIQSPPQTGNC